MNNSHVNVVHAGILNGFANAALNEPVIRIADTSKPVFLTEHRDALPFPCSLSAYADATLSDVAEGASRALSHLLNGGVIRDTATLNLDLSGYSLATPWTVGVYGGATVSPEKYRIGICCKIIAHVVARYKTFLYQAYLCVE